MITYRPDRARRGRSKTTPFRYQALFTPWRPLIHEAPTVIALRVALLPMMWWLDPIAASRETRRMSDEKQAAFGAWQYEAWQTPVRFWRDFSVAAMAATPAIAAARAMQQSTARLAHPWNQAVQANRERLERIAMRPSNYPITCSPPCR